MFRLPAAKPRGSLGRSRTIWWRRNQRAAYLHKERPMTTATTDVKRKTGDGSKTATAGPLSAEELRKMDAYWRASNFLSVGQIYLLDNPLLKEPLKREHIKPRLLGHWGTSPGLNML